MLELRGIALLLYNSTKPCYFPRSTIGSLMLSGFRGILKNPYDLSIFSRNVELAVAFTSPGSQC